MHQLIIGNTLLCFALWVILELAIVDGFAVLQHPAEPEDAPEKASIWRLPFLRILLAMDHVQKIRFAQGLMGSFAPKPTHLLVVNLPDLLTDLHRNRASHRQRQGWPLENDGAQGVRSCFLQKHGRVLHPRT